MKETVSFQISKEKIKNVACKFYPLIISAILVSIWFHKGIMIAVGEDGIPFYNLQRTANLYSSGFYDQGLSLTWVFNLPRFITFELLSIFHFLGFSGYVTQVLLFFVLLLIPLLFIPKLSKEIYVKNYETIGFLTSLFYLFNLYTVSQVFTRFVLSFIFLWSYLPLFLYLWICYIKTLNFRYLLSLVLSTFVYSAMFVVVSPVMTIWIAALIVSLFVYIKSKIKLKVLGYALLGFALWLVTNLWWIFPYYQARNDNYEMSITSSKNIESLIEVSKHFPNAEIALLRQSYMFGSNSPYFEFYKGDFNITLSKIIFLVVVFGFVISIKKKSFSIPTLLLVGWFLCKGTNPPLGKEFYSFVFEKLSFFQVYRNPYEKAGVLFLLPYSFLFGIGLSTISGRFNKIQNLIVLFSISLFCGYLLKPMFDGSLFRNTSYVIVPSYYKTLNDIISVPNDDARILQLPLLRGPSIHYDWNFMGDEPSEFLFDNASVSRTSLRSDQIIFYNKLGDPKYFYKNENFSKILAILKIKYIILHNDAVLGNYYQENVDESRAIVKSWKGIQHIKDVGKLELYKNDFTTDGRLYLSNNTISVKDLDELFAKITSVNFNTDRDVVLLPGQVNFELDKNFKIPTHKIYKFRRTKYQIVIENSEKPFIIVLSNSFDSRWELSENGKLLVNSFLVNGFANGWVIDKRGSYTLDVEYKVWPWE